MGEARGQFKNSFNRSPSLPEGRASCFDNFLSITFTSARGRAVLHASANASAGQQSARLQSAQILTGSRHRQAYALSDRGYSLVWLADQKSNNLEAFVISQDTAGAPKRRLISRRND
jgi:hypothetical protein